MLGLMICCVGGKAILAKDQPLIPSVSFPHTEQLFLFKLKGTSIICSKIRYLLVTNEAANFYLPFHWKLKKIISIVCNSLYCHYLEWKYAERYKKAIQNPRSSVYSFGLYAFHLIIFLLEISLRFLMEDNQIPLSYSQIF